MIASPHIHSYVFYKITRLGAYYYKCNSPNCFYTADKRLLLGKECMCPICNTHTLILTNEDLKRKVPRCLYCSNTKEARKKRAYAQLLARAQEKKLAEPENLIDSEESVESTENK